MKILLCLLLLAASPASSPDSLQEVEVGVLLGYPENALLIKDEYGRVFIWEPSLSYESDSFLPAEAFDYPSLLRAPKPPVPPAEEPFFHHPLLGPRVPNDPVPPPAPEPEPAFASPELPPPPFDPSLYSEAVVSEEPKDEKVGDEPTALPLSYRQPSTRTPN